MTDDELLARLSLVLVSIEYPGMSDGNIARLILEKYEQFLDPLVVDPVTQLTAIGRIPQQNGTDLEYLHQLAARYGFIFRIDRSTTGKPIAYWGPFDEQRPNDMPAPTTLSGSS